MIKIDEVFTAKRYNRGWELHETRPTHGNRQCAGCGKEAQPDDSLCKSCSDKVDKTVLSYDVLPVQGELFGKKSAHNPPK